MSRLNWSFTRTRDTGSPSLRTRWMSCNECSYGSMRICRHAQCNSETVRDAFAHAISRTRGMKMSGIESGSPQVRCAGYRDSICAGRFMSVLFIIAAMSAVPHIVIGAELPLQIAQRHALAVAYIEEHADREEMVMTPMR